MDESRRTATGGAARRIVSGVTSAMVSVAQHHPRVVASQDPKARQRQQMLAWHQTHGRNVSRTARRFGYSRTTVYRCPLASRPRRNGGHWLVGTGRVQPVCRAPWLS